MTRCDNPNCAMQRERDKYAAMLPADQVPVLRRKKCPGCGKKVCTYCGEGIPRMTGRCCGSKFVRKEES